MRTPSKSGVLALNAGSSSIKASVLRGEERLVTFLAERLTTPESTLHIFPKDKPEIVVHDGNLSHADALSRIIGYLEENGMLSSLVAVGHRVVHGGSSIPDSVVVTAETYEEISAVSHLAPLHNLHNLAGIKAVRELKPDIPNVAVFDTSFHSTIPAKAYTYPIPLEYRSKGMRKFGFHGTSIKYVSQKATALLHSVKSNQESFQLVVCHLGNGASVTAVSGNESRETSMGFTPLSGLMMGTRCGNIDPSVVGFACHALNKDVDEVLHDFNERSGLKAMTADGASDMRQILSRTDDPDAQLAVDMFVYRLAQHIVACMVALDAPMDALVFTAGIGEHSAEIRRRTIEQLATVLPHLKLDAQRNEIDGNNSNGIISPDGTWPLVLDIATDEEAMIAKECLRLVQ
jgi:acetate kinase